MLGMVSAIVAPNGFHISHTSDWAKHCSNAEVYAPSSVFDKIGCDHALALDAPFEAAWLGEIEHHFVDLGGFGEGLFFHRASGTLIVTDLMQNFEPERIASPITRLIMALGGATGPKGGPSIEIRIAAIKHRKRLAEAVATMLAWRPARIVLSHGKCYEGNAENEIKAAFGWIV